MHFIRSSAAAVLLLAVFAVQASSQAAPTLRTLFYIGDSTVRNGRGDGANGEWGWGDLTPALFDSTRIRVENRALGGRSSRTYLTQAHWNRVLAQLRPGDIVLMQFGHNDASPVNDTSRARGTLPGVGNDSVQIQNFLTGQRETVHTFGWYLRRYIRDARARGATPIVASLVPRNLWENGRVVRNQNDYAGWARHVAAQERVAFIDLNETIAREYERLGAERVRTLFGRDHVHTNLEGARLNARLAVAALRALPNSPVAAYLLPVRHFLFAYFRGNGEDGLHLAHSEDGLRWAALRGDSSFLRPAVGIAKLMRDPSIVQGPDGTFHMVWTAGWNERGIGYASSRDLIHWSEQKYIPVMEHEPTALNTWAPELFYDEERREFLVFWASTVPGRFPTTDGQDASGPGRPGYNHRIYFVATRDFQDFSRAELFYEPGFNVIDAAIFRDGERYVMLLKDETNKPFTPQKNIRLAFGESPRGPFNAPTGPISGDEWAEGPTVLQIDGKWHVYFDKYRQHRYGLATSRNLMQWTDESNRLSMPAGIRHGTAFEVSAEVAQRLLSREQPGSGGTIPDRRSPAPPRPQP